MEAQKRSPGAVAAATGAQEGKKHASKPTKILRVLHGLVERNSLTRLDAWRLYGDACLNTTVSTIQQRFGITVARELIQVEGRFGTARVARYWLSPSEKARARRILGINGEVA